MELSELIREIKETSKNDLSEEYLKYNSLNTREDAGIDQHCEGITMIPVDWVLPYLEQLQVKGKKSCNKRNNFQRVTKDEKSLIAFVRYEVLDLNGPHMDHSIEHFRTSKKFLDWLNKEVDFNEQPGK